jgi:mRNA interferase RelE/StbE
MLVEYKERALEQLEQLPRDLQKRITDKIDFFASQPKPLSFAKPLTGYNAHRFRIGNYRAIAEVEGEVLTILLIEKRDGAYRNL